MKRLFTLAPVLLLAACAQSPIAKYLPPSLGGPVPVVEPEVVGPPPVPPEVASYLPEGVPGSLVMLDVNGCYVFSIEVTNPQTGFPVLDNNGNQVCPAPEGAVAAVETVPAAPVQG